MSWEDKLVLWVRGLFFIIGMCIVVWYAMLYVYLDIFEPGTNFWNSQPYPYLNFRYSFLPFFALYVLMGIALRPGKTLLSFILMIVGTFCLAIGGALLVTGGYDGLLLSVIGAGIVLVALTGKDETSTPKPRPPKIDKKPTTRILEYHTPKIEGYPYLNNEFLSDPDIENWIRNQSDINLLRELLSHKVIEILEDWDTDYQKSGVIQTPAIDRLFELDATIGEHALREFLGNVEFETYDDPEGPLRIQWTTLSVLDHAVRLACSHGMTKTAEGILDRILWSYDYVNIVYHRGLIDWAIDHLAELKGTKSLDKFLRLVVYLPRWATTYRPKYNEKIVRIICCFGDVAIKRLLVEKRCLFDYSEYHRGNNDYVIEVMRYCTDPKRVFLISCSDNWYTDGIGAYQWSRDFGVELTPKDIREAIQEGTNEIKTGAISFLTDAPCNSEFRELMDEFLDDLDCDE